MRSWVLALSLMGILATSFVSAVRYRDEEYNAIVIDDDPDEVVGLDPSEEDYTTTQLPTTDNQNITTCTSSRGERGTCVQFDKCFPYMSSANADYFNNDYLVSILRELAPPCQGGSGLVCCPDLSYDGLPTRKPQFEGQTTMKSTTTTAATVAASNGTSPSDNRNSECGKHNHSPVKVVGGRLAQQGEFPYTVALLQKGKQFCGGSLISSQWVLTAAHCIANFQNFASVSLNVGDHDVSKQSEVKHQSRTVKRGFFHRSFSMSHLQHDVALLQLSQPVTLSDTASVVCLSNTEPPFGGSGTLSGWGKTSKNGPPSPVLRTVTMTILQHEECRKTYAAEPRAPKVTTNMVCAGDKTPVKDACNGDSGGPLVRFDGDKATQFGIVSWGIGCGEKPGVYTRVDKYLDWIEKNSKRTY